MSHKIWVLLIPTLLLAGCRPISPCAHFESIQDEVICRSGESIGWDSRSAESIFSDCVHELLQEELTAESAVQIALLNNRNLQATYEELGIATAQLMQAGLLQNPILSVSYRFSTKRGISDLVDIGIFQNFLEILLMPMKKRRACAELAATKALITARVLEVIAQTKIAFYNLQADYQIWELQKEILLAKSAALDLANRLYEAGNITQLELMEVLLAYENEVLIVDDFEIRVMRVKESLNRLMGLFGEQICWDFSKVFSPCVCEEPTLCGLEHTAIVNSLDLQAACQKMIATGAQFGVDTSRLVIPQFSVGPDSEREDGVWFVGPAFALAIPLFDFGQAMRATARAELFRQWNDYLALGIEIRSKARIAKALFLNTMQHVQYYREDIVPLAEQITETSLSQYNAMQISIFDLLEAKEHELENKIQAAITQRDYWMAKTSLELLISGHMLPEGEIL